MLGNFIYSKTKNLFLQELEAGNVLDEAIVFIEDTKEIWNHGVYFDGKNIDLTNYETIEESVLKLLEAKTYTDEAINSFDTKVITQKIHLPKGWSCISFYVNTTLQELQTALGTNGISIETTSTGGISDADLINTYSNGTWTGNITELDFSKMYMIEVSSECDIYLTGEQINPADLSITLQEGWNWIGYPVSQELDINVALKNLQAKEGDYIKGKNDDEDAWFVEGYGWWSETGDFKFKPGHGYMFNSVDTKNFTYPDTYYKPFGNVEISSELGESTIKAASQDLVTKVSEESKQYVNDKIDNLNKVTQTIDLLKGYIWVSFYVNVTLEDVQKALGTNGISISTASVGNEDDIFSNYDSETGTWSGDLTELDFTKMYLIQTNESDTIEVSGELLNVEDYTISLEPGWNWIGYPSNEIIDVDVAFNNLEPVDSDVINTQNNGSAEYAYGQWLGSLQTMVPGIGYKYFNTSSEIKTFKFPSRLDIRLSQKQDKLVSGTNIKTVNGTSILGSGDIVIESGSEQIQSDWNETDTTSKSYIANKPNIRQDEAKTIEIGSNLQNTIFYGNSFIDFLHSEKIYVDNPNRVFEILDQNEKTLLKFDKYGDGTKFLAGDCTYKSISTAYPQVNHGISDTTFALTPNVLHVWDEVAELSLTLANPTDTTIANEYLFQFTSGTIATTLTLPDTVKWLETPSIESDKVYQVSILNNFGTILGFV